MIDPRTFLRLPLNFQNKCKVYPPSLEEVLSEEHFAIWQQVLTISQEDLDDEAAEKNREGQVLTPMEYMMAIACQSEELRQAIKEGIEFFIKQPITFLYDIKAILIGEIEEVLKTVKSQKDLVMISEENYFDFQNTIRIVLGQKPLDNPTEDTDPRIRRMKALARKRDRIKAKQGGGISLQTSLEAICCMGIGLTPLNIGQLSYAAVSALMERYQMKEKYEIDIKSLMAGAKASKVNPTYWIKNQE